MRVLRPGGRLGMANWTPDSWVGEQFRLQARYQPPPAGVLPPAAWGTLERLEDLIGGEVSDLTTSQEYVELVHHSTASLFELFKDWFGPVASVLARLDPDRADAFTRDWLDLADAAQRRHRRDVRHPVDLPAGRGGQAFVRPCRRGTRRQAVPAQGRSRRRCRLLDIM